MLEIRFVEWSRSEDHRERHFIVACVTQQTRAQFAEEVPYTPHTELAHRVRQYLLDDLAILERVARAGGRLRAVGEQPPVPIRRAGEVGGVDVKPIAILRLQAVACPQKIRMTECELSGHAALDGP